MTPARRLNRPLIWLAFWMAVAVILYTMTAPKVHAVPVEAFAIYQVIETSRTAPWLDQSCYDDDHTLEVNAYGWLDAGETFTYQTPLPVCSSKIVRGLATAAKRDEADLIVTDWYADVHPGRAIELPKGRHGYAACNTDSKSDVQVMLEDEREAPVSWSLTALTGGAYRLEMVMNEPWWEGGESDYGYCEHTP